MSKILSDEEFSELMNRTRAGDQKAAQKLVQWYDPEIRRAARLRLTDPRLRRIVDSIDICQSVFGRFFKSAADGSFAFEKPEELLGLLITMTRNRVIDEHRRQTSQKRKNNEITDETHYQNNIIEQSPGPRTAAEAKELLTEVRSRLKPDELIIADRRNAGESWNEISAALGEPVDTLRKRLERALQRVRTELSGLVKPAEA